MFGKRSNVGGKDQMTFRERLRLFTWPVANIAVVTSIAMFNFGFDVLLFSGLIAMPYFAMEFGAQNDEGEWVVPGATQSIMSATPFAGKLVGIWISAPLSQKYGRKPMFALIIAVSIVGVLLQITATTVAQFTIGRVLCYGMTGICSTVLPPYMGETSPTQLRGLLIAQMHLQMTLGQIVGSGVNAGTSNIESEASWMIPVGLQFVMPCLMVVGYPFLVESPRWLVAKDRIADALASLRKLRGPRVSEAQLRQEMDQITMFDTNREKGPWKEVWQGTNRRRVLISMAVMAGQQLTGQVFILQYGIVFYQDMGYENAFLLQFIGMAIGLVTSVFTGLVVDTFGRRPLLIVGAWGQAAALLVVGAIGCVINPSVALERLMIVCFYIWGIAFCLSWAPLSYIIMAEVSSARLVEKFNLISVTTSVVIAFAVSLSCPYLINQEYADLGGKVGFLYGGFAVCMSVVAWLFVPETKGRTLEELDILFRQETKTRQFSKVVVDVDEFAAAQGAVRTEKYGSVVGTVMEDSNSDKV